MQELIEWLLERKNKTAQNLHFEKGLHSALDSCINEAKSLLEKEKEVMKSCIVAGMEFIPVDPNHYNEDAEEIYNETFNTKEK